MSEEVVWWLVYGDYDWLRGLGGGDGIGGGRETRSAGIDYIT